MSREQGSTIPLLLGFFLIALLIVAGSVAAGDAFVQRRALQDVCDGAAAAAAASAVDLDRADGVGTGPALRFTHVQHAVDDYLSRDPGRHGIHVDATLSPDARTLTLHCTQTRLIVFGSLFGKGSGARFSATSAARAPIR